VRARAPSRRPRNRHPYNRKSGIHEFSRCALFLPVDIFKNRIETVKENLAVAVNARRKDLLRPGPKSDAKTVAHHVTEANKSRTGTNALPVSAARRFFR
jgi:hypothetical protein